jgi:hypothetical protein
VKGWSDGGSVTSMLPLVRPADLILHIPKFMSVHPIRSTQHPG